MYATQTDRILRVTNADGSCPFAPTAAFPTLSLTPATIMPNPSQGTPETFTATIHYASVPAGTPVTLTVIGPNFHKELGRTDPNGQAAFTYAETFAGTDALVATSTVWSQAVISNVVRVTWEAGPHTTFTDLNNSVKSGMLNAPASLTGSLFDVSVSPPVPIPSVPLSLSVGGESCSGTTDANGVVTCAVTPGSTGILPLTGTFAGTQGFLASNASSDFLVPAAASPPPPPPPGPPPAPTALPTPSTALVPKSLSFASHAIGSVSSARKVTVTNSSVVALQVYGITSSNPAFTETDNCVGTVRPHRSCTIDVVFAPTAMGGQTATLNISDNIKDPVHHPQLVTLTGVGVAPANQVFVEPGELTFAPQKAGTVSPPQKVTLANRQGDPVRIKQIATSGGFKATSGCGTTLAAHWSCTIEVAFAPVKAGEQSGALTIANDSTASPLKVTLNGMVPTPTPAPTMRATPTRRASPAPTPRGR